MDKSDGLISVDKLAAIEVKNWLNFWAISKGLFIVIPLKKISEIGFFGPLLLIASLIIAQVFFQVF
jgi:uncharacterized membrane protein